MAYPIIKVYKENGSIIIDNGVKRKEYASPASVSYSVLDDSFLRSVDIVTLKAFGLPVVADKPVDSFVDEDGAKISPNVLWSELKSYFVSLGMAQNSVGSSLLNVKSFGAKGDGIQDDTNSFKRAINASKETGFAKIEIPQGHYKITQTIDLPRDCPLIGMGSKTILDFSTAVIAPDKAAISISEPYGNLGADITILKDLILMGMPTIISVYPGANGFKNCSGIEFNTPILGIEGVYINGFNHSTLFKSNCYLIFFDRVCFRGNNYGFFFDKTGYNNSGENINLNNCIIANNNFGLFNKSGEVVMKGTSIDYNKIPVLDNSNDDDGFSNSKTTFLMCHMESDDFEITNHGIMSISECELWCQGFSPDSYTNKNPIINNYGQLTLSNNHYRIPGYRYFVQGNPPIVSSGGTGSLDTENMYVHKLMSKIHNSDFELNDLTGFKVNYGSAAISTEQRNSGTQSLKVTGELFANGEVEFEVPVKGDFCFCNASGYIHLNGSMTIPYITIRKFSKANTQIGNDLTFAPETIPNPTGFTYGKSDWVPLQPNVAYIKIIVKLDIGTNKAMFVDDVYVNFK